jgi:1-acyl-sn-glycerol-3-phosphate acyltransferase
VIFPQGTRRRHKILDFKHGGVTLAQEANVPLVPVTIELPEDLYAIGCKVSGCMHTAITYQSYDVYISRAVFPFSRSYT